MPQIVWGDMTSVVESVGKVLDAIESPRIAAKLLAGAVVFLVVLVVAGDQLVTAVEKVGIPLWAAWAGVALVAYAIGNRRREARDMIVRLVSSVGLFIALGIATGCGGSSSEPQIQDISGSWTYTESYSNAALRLWCQNEGAMDIQQSGSNLTGTFGQTGTCTNLEGSTFDNSGTGAVSGGQIDGSQVSFNAGGCDYSGSISGSPPNRMTGSVGCTPTRSGQNYVFTGTWQASR